MLYTQLKSTHKRVMANNMNEVLQLLKYIKSLKGDYQGFAQHTNSRDIDTITICCANLLQDNIPLPISKKKSVKLLLAPIEKDIKSLSKRGVSIKKRRAILTNPQVGSGILTLLAGTLLPAIISAFIR